MDSKKNTDYHQPYPLFWQDTSYMISVLVCAWGACWWMTRWRIKDRWTVPAQDGPCPLLLNMCVTSLWKGVMSSPCSTPRSSAQAAFTTGVMVVYWINCFCCLLLFVVNGWQILNGDMWKCQNMNASVLSSTGGKISVCVCICVHKCVCMCMCVCVYAC